MIMVTDQVWAWRSALLIFCLVSLPLFHSFFSILTETHACVYLFFLSQENATIVLRTRITVGNNNSLCQLAGEMAASFNSPPICTSSSDRNTSTCLWQRPAAYTGGRCVIAKHQSAQLVHYTRCSRRWGQLLNAMENPWHLEVCIQVHKMGLKSVKKYQLLLEYLWSLCARLNKVKIYSLISFVSAAKSCSLQRLEEYLLSESHFTTELLSTECSVLLWWYMRQKEHSLTFKLQARACSASN